MSNKIGGVRHIAVCPTYGSKGIHKGLDTRGKPGTRYVKKDESNKLRECIKSGKFPKQDKDYNFVAFIHKQFFGMSYISLVNEEIKADMFSKLCNFRNRGLIKLELEGNFINVKR